MTYAIVIPTIGRASLDRLLASLTGERACPTSVVVVDDRAEQHPPLTVSDSHLPVRVVASGGHGPAAARNTGWRAATADAPVDWIVFLDDDVEVDVGWAADLQRDLDRASDGVVAIQGMVRVPPPSGRRPTDDERQVLALASATWITADLAVRRHALLRVGGFDERFPRPHREDTDLAMRLSRVGSLERGTRSVVHPTRQGGLWASVRRQAGNADDAWLRAKHGRRWRSLTGERPGALRWHVASMVALAAAAARRRSAASRVALLVWMVLTARFWVARARSGPREPAELARLAITSAVIPPAAVAHRLRGELRALRLLVRV